MRVLSARMKKVLKRQAGGALGGLIPCSLASKRSREALKRRGLLDGFAPTAEGWRLAAELFELDGDDRAESCSYLATGKFRLARATG